MQGTRLPTQGSAPQGANFADGMSGDDAFLRRDEFQDFDFNFTRDEPFSQSSEAILSPQRKGTNGITTPSHDASRDATSGSKASSPQRSLSAWKDSSTEFNEHYRGKDSGEDIRYLYLTYETQLPQAWELVQEKHHESPQPPDLTAYRNPFYWSPGRKSGLIWLSCVGTTLTAYAAGSYTAGSEQMSREWGVGSIPIAAGVTAFTAGFGIAPMILAPFSEINGRRPVFVVTGLLFMVFVLTCGLTPTFPGMIVVRFLGGCASSTFSTMVGGVVADIYVAADRNRPMALFTGGAFFGTGLGPLLSGFVAYYVEWRWIFYAHSIAVAVLMVFVWLFFYETRGNILLSKMAKKLNHYYEKREKAGFYGFDMPIEGSDGKERQRIRWKVKADEERQGLLQMITISLYRPFHMLFTEPVVFFFSLWISFSWAVLYSTFSVIPYIYQKVYGFDLEETESVFAAVSIGAVIAALISIFQDKLPIYQKSKLSKTPEGRLYFACVESMLMPVGLFWLGWTARSSIHWSVPTVAIGCATIGIFSVYLATFNYLADAYKAYASSAIACQSFCRNMMAGAFPLFTDQMFDKLTIGGAGSLLGGVAIVLTIVPWVLVLFGPRIRARSKFAQELAS